MSTPHAVPFVVAPAPPCPSCDSTSTVQACGSIGAQVEPGDLVICLKCGDVSIVTATLKLRPFVGADLAFYDAADLAHVTQAVALMRDALARRN